VLKAFLLLAQPGFSNYFVNLLRRMFIRAVFLLSADGFQDFGFGSVCPMRESPS
jgi:hypothetical protein